MLAATALCVGGCLPYWKQEVKFVVVDGETGLPPPGARVSVGYDWLPFFNRPKNLSRTLAADGSAVVRVAPEWYPKYSFPAPGYTHHSQLPQNDGWLPEERIPCRLGEADGPRRRPCLLVALYREPSPTLVLVLPEGYIGPVALELPFGGTLMSGEPGQRQFEFVVPPSGYVRRAVDPMQRRAAPTDVEARWAGGEPLPHAWHERPAQVALRWVDSHGDRHLYAVGPQALEWQLAEQVQDITYQPNGGRTTIHKPDKFHAFMDALVARAADGGAASR